MAALDALLRLQSTIFLLIAAGYVLTKLGVLPLTARKPLTDLIIDFILPCNIIVSFLIEFNAQILRDCLAVFVVSAVIQAAVFVISRPLCRRLLPGPEQPVWQYGLLVSNAGFLGSPIAEGMYGPQGLLYASIYLVPMRMMMWSVGVACFAGGGIKGRGVLKKTLTHPCIVAVLLGLLLMLTQLPLPAGLEAALRAASSCNTALCMLVIGNILAEVDPRDVLHGKSLLYCLLRLVVLPLLVLAGCRLAALEPLVTAVSVVLTGMPAAATTAILAARYEKAERQAVALVFLSTLGSLVTVPALALLTELL